MEPQVIGFAGILVANLVAAIDAAALSVSLPTIASQMNASGIQAYWAGTSFVLSSAACQPLFPAFSNAFGRRPMVVVALVFLIIGTIICATAENMTSLLAGRTIQGVGGGGVLAMTYTVMTDLFNLRQRSTAIAVNGLVWLLGTSLGPILGGVLSSHASWRWIFWICLPFLVIALALSMLLGPRVTSNDSVPDDRAASTQPSSWKRIDWVGAGLFVASLTAFLVPVSWGGLMFAWHSWRTIVPLVVGSVGLIAWLFYESRFPANPMMPLSIFTNRTTSCSLVGTLMLGIIQFGLVFYLPLYYQIIKGYSPTISGVALLPVTMLSGLSTAITGILIAKLGKYKLVVLIGWTILALGLGLLELFHITTSIPQWVFVSAVSGIGGGILFTALAVASQAHVQKEHIAVAAALTPFIRAIGQAIGITVGNSIIQNQLKQGLARASSATLQSNADYIARNLASPNIVALFKDDEQQEAQLLSAYNFALNDFWWLLLAAALFAGLLSFAVQDVSLDRAAPSTGSIDSSSVDTAEPSMVEKGPVSKLKGLTHADDQDALRSVDRSSTPASV